MSPDTRRRLILLVAAVIVVALVLASTGCSTTSGDDDGAVGDDGAALTGALYTQTMNDVCAATTERLRELPTPPDEISRADWAGEVSRLLRDEATALDEILVGESRRDDHASFVENTEDQAAQWRALGEALASEDATDPAIGELTTEIGELTLGRNALAGEMSVTGCQEREL